MTSKKEKIKIKAHGGLIDIQGVSVAKVDNKIRIQSVETWFDPMEMFRQMKTDEGLERKELVEEGKSLSDQLEEEDVTGGGCPFIANTE